MEEYEVIRIPVSDGTEKEFAIMDTFTVEEKHYMAVSVPIGEGLFLQEFHPAGNGGIFACERLFVQMLFDKNQNHIGNQGIENK